MSAMKNWARTNLSRWSTVRSLAPPLNPISRSAPAQNVWPAPVSTMALTRSSTSHRPKTRSSSSAICCVKALRLSGRFRVTTTTGVAVAAPVGECETLTWPRGRVS